MSIITNVSKSMSEYLLAGWALTNDPCPNCSMPRMRSPAYLGEDTKLVCLNCDPPPTGGSKPLKDSTDRLSVSSVSDGLTGRSTPPTDLSPPVSPPLMLPPPSQETLRRRAQSDQASQEIADRMLRGWTMLADECPNPSCYGIPLVRAPGETSAKECVVCHNKYLPASDPRASSSEAKVQPPPSPKTLPRETKLRKGKETENKPPASVLAADMHNLVKESSTTPNKLPSRSSGLKESLNGSLSLLEELLDDANSSRDIQRIGEIAESITKVTSALKAVQNL
ncbi:hypothetical protein CPB86DRAFT_877217 [Serendipita vermifera]|nr:hypothetical protein CPB86DRAFT_877217 [Serendipita vermifera]